VIDLAYLAPQGCRDVLESSEAPVVLSHASPRRAFGGDARRIMEATAKKDGVIGITAFNQPDLAA
jgi:microsomal dipeptidase-like Zn-dependent dipeptidase